MSDELVLSKKMVELTTKKAGTFAVTKEGEAYLIKLIEWKDYIEARIEEAKEQMAADATKAGEDHILGDTLRVAVRPSGKKYEGGNPEFMKTVSYEKIDEKAVDEYQKKEGKVPEGIVPVLQKVGATIYVKKDKKG